MPDSAAAQAVGASSNQSPNARRSFWSVLRRMVLVAAGLHGVFLLLFLLLGLGWLAVVNVASMAALLLAQALLGRKRTVPAAWLLLAEIVLHAGLAVALLGADGGFQYYVLLLVLPMTLVMDGAAASKLGRVAVLGAYFCLLDALPRVWPPLYTLQVPVLAAMRYFNIVCMLSSMALFSLLYTQLINRAEMKLLALATTDPLTGLNNRRQMLDIVRRTPPRQQAGGPAHCVLLCDIDHFKAINDSHGHEAGDAALRAVGQVLKASLREQDAVARWGGEEFMVLVRDADLATALQAAERLRRAVAAVMVPVSDGRHNASGGSKIRLTMTVGVALARQGESISQVIARADAALYRGKATGRNRVEAETGIDTAAVAVDAAV